MKRKLTPTAAVKIASVPAVIAEIPRISEVRGLQVVLDVDLADGFEISTYRLNEAVKRNAERFPEDFCFQLTQQEWQVLISQIAISKSQLIDLKRKNAFKIGGRGGRRTPPYVFTEHGVTMVAGLLKSRKAVALSIHIVREFVRLRRAAISYGELNRRINQLEDRLGDDIKDIWEVLHHMLMHPAPISKPICFVNMEET